MRDICKAYRLGDEDMPVLKNVNLSLEEGEYLSILGPSGSGKSTLMNIIGCLDIATSGEYQLHGRMIDDLSEAELARIRSHEIGFIFQNSQLLPRLTALKNVELPLIYAGVAPRERRRRAEEMLGRVGLSDRLHHLPSQLSGGQQQRVAIARALALHPDILCFDEPTSALDPELTGEVLRVLRDLADRKTTMIIVTHEMHFARDVADRILFMDGGVVVEEGPAKELIDHPKEERTKQFLAHYSE